VRDQTTVIPRGETFHDREQPVDLGDGEGSSARRDDDPGGEFPPSAPSSSRALAICTIWRWPARRPARSTSIDGSSVESKLALIDQIHHAPPPSPVQRKVVQAGVLRDAQVALGQFTVHDPDARPNASASTRRDLATADRDGPLS
jgi:hypothetical protein